MWTRWGTGNICCETVQWRGSGLLQLDPEGNGGDSSHLQEKLLRPLTPQMCNKIINSWEYSQEVQTSDGIRLFLIYF